MARDEALAFAERAERAVERLDELHADRVRNGAAIARTHQELGLCLKLAEVHATLAVAEELRSLREERER